MSDLDPLSSCASDQPDPTMEEVEETFGIPRRQQYKLIRAGEIVSFMFAGRRRIDRASVWAYRQRQVSKGPELQALPTNKRRVGRPRKEQQQPASPAE